MVALDPITAGLNLGSKILDILGLDPETKAKAQVALMDAAQRGDLAQLNVNITEASSASLFVAGWRPFVGWVCASAMAFNFIGLPLLGWISAIWVIPIPIPLDLTTMLPVLLGMLGLGGMRTYEKYHGVSKER